MYLHTLHAVTVFRRYLDVRRQSRLPIDRTGVAGRVGRRGGRPALAGVFQSQVVVAGAPGGGGAKAGVARAGLGGPEWWLLLRYPAWWP